MSWFCEDSFHSTHRVGFKVKKHLHSEQSKFQKIDVIDTHSVGKLLLLDNKCMVSEADEFVYHEVVPEIEEIHLVEIDERVIEVSKKFFPECTIGLDDPRVQIMPMDGIEFVQNKTNHYDIIIVDSTDPEDFASGLFTKDFYQSIYNALTPDGIMLNQTENPFLDEYNIKKIYNNMRASFPIVQSFNAPMIIYPGVYWSFGFCSKKYRANNINPEKRLHMESLQRNLQWYNMDWHLGNTHLSNFHKKMIGEI